MNSFSKVNDKKVIYFTEFIGLTAQKNKAYVDEVMDDWANLAVEGHFMLKTLVGLSRAFSAPLGKIMGASI
jgi:kynureninase